MKILGIDPGSRVAGFALLTSSGGLSFKVCDVGCWHTKSKTGNSLERIGALHESVYELAAKAKPDICVIESVFMGNHARSALTLGQARGVIIAAIHRHRIPIAELAPTQIKRLVTGQGQASKAEVSQAVQRLCKLDTSTWPHDVSDALAIALGFIFSGGI